MNHYSRVKNHSDDNEYSNESVNDIEYDNTENELEDIIFNSDITDEEIIKAVNALKRGQSSGEDELMPEFFICTINLILPIINCLFNRILNTGDFSPSSGLSILVTLFKKWNISKPNNYRGISLLDVIGKIYTSVITRRITFLLHT